jgi:hypothetical protein
MNLSTLPLDGLDLTLLGTALALGNAFAFGVVQLVLKNFVPEYKPTAFIVISSIASVALYFGLASEYVLVKLAIAAVASAYGVTGGIDFYKKDVKN